MEVTNARLEFIADNPSCTIQRGETESIAKELQMYRGLAEMRKVMLDMELGKVFGGYSEDELRICKNCKWWQRIYESECGDCDNQTVSNQIAVPPKNYTFFKPVESFGCNQWEAKGEAKETVSSISIKLANGDATLGEYRKVINAIIEDIIRRSK